MANTMKALAFMYVILTRDSLGAPIDVDRPVNATPAPFVSRDSVYRYILDLLDSARADLRTADAGSVAFPFPLPPGLAGFDTPGSFKLLNRALAAKAAILRATAAGCGVPCYTRALADLDSSFLNRSATTALRDLDQVRVNVGKLPPTTLTAASADPAFITELLYNRRYSLLWEQGTRWIDARRFGLLNTIPPQVSGGSVPVAMPVPNAECSARGLDTDCTP